MGPIGSAAVNSTMDPILHSIVVVLKFTCLPWPRPLGEWIHFPALGVWTLPHCLLFQGDVSWKDASRNLKCACLVGLPLWCSSEDCSQSWNPQLCPQPGPNNSGHGDNSAHSRLLLIWEQGRGKAQGSFGAA